MIAITTQIVLVKRVRVSNREIDKIDWEQLWNDELKRSKVENTTQLNWDKFAEQFERQYSRSDYRDKMLERVHTRPDDTVLDIGCGPGNLAVPLASRVKSVTALDMSLDMLRLAKQQAEAQKISNITFVQFDWEDIVIGKDIQPHDVVVCSRAFPKQNPRESLAKLNQAANKYVYLTLKTVADDAYRFYTNLYQEIGKEYRTYPDYIYAYNLLYQMGILAHVDFIEYTDTFRYKKAEDAFQILNSHIRVETREQKDKLMAFVLRNMEKNNGFKLDMKCKWALLWWEK